MHQQHHVAPDDGQLQPTRHAPASAGDPVLRAGPLQRSLRDRVSSAPRLVPPAIVLVIGYVGMVAVLVGVGALIVHSGALAGLRDWDDAVTRWMADHRNGVLDPVTGVLSRAADTTGVVAFALVVEIVLVVQRRWWALLIVPVALGLELTTFLTVNAIVDRPRPSVARLGSEPSTSSFPSGHTAATVVLWGAIALLFVWSSAHRWLRTAAVAVVLALAVFVGTARVYRGMHHPSDVIAGGLMGLAALSVTVLAVRLAARQAPVDDPRADGAAARSRGGVAAVPS